MRVFITVLVLIFSLQSWTKADDIRDFEIEGMSIGDSLLDYFSEGEIKKANDESYEDRLFITKTIVETNSNLYEGYQFTYKESDKKKILHNINGVIEYPNKIKECKKEVKKIVSQLSLIFPGAVKNDWGKLNTNNGGYYFPVTFDFEDSARAMVACYDWSKESGIPVNLKVTLYSAEYSEYLKKKNR